MTRWVAGGLAAVVLAAAAVAGLVWWRSTSRTPLVEALALAPADTQRYSWTDWAGVRRELDAGVGADSSADAVEDFLSSAYDADLAATSALVTDAGLVHRRTGVSPATATWELFTQAEDGAVIMLGLPDDLSADDLSERLLDAGYTAPEGDDRVWDGTELLGDFEWPTDLGFVALDADRHVLVGSDSADYLRSVLDGDDEPDEDVTAAAEALDEPLSAAVYSGDWACAELAMSQADDTDEAQGEELVAQAGRVDPLRSFALAAQPGGDVLAAMTFADHEQARRNADTRSRLASGAAPGQGGAFTDRFALGEVRADGRVLTMELDPVDGSYVLSDLATGPLLFATC